MKKLLILALSLASALSGHDVNDIKRRAATLLGEIDSAKKMFPQCTQLFTPFEHNLSPLYELTYRKRRGESAVNSYKTAGILAQHLRGYYQDEKKAGHTLLAIVSNKIKEEYAELVFTAKQAHDTYQFKTPQSKL